MADAPSASIRRPQKKNDQRVPTWPSSDVRPAPSFIPSSAFLSGPASPHGKANQPIITVPTGPKSNKGYVMKDQPKTSVPTPKSGPAFSHGKENQPKMTVPTGPRSNKGNVKNDQPRLPIPNTSASKTRPVPPSHLVANSSDLASLRARLGQPRMQVPTALAPNMCQAPRTQPASTAPSIPAFVHPRKRPRPEPKALNIVSGHNLTPNSGIESSSSTSQDSKTVQDHPAVGRGLDEKENQKTRPTHTAQRPEGAPSTHNPQFNSAQSFAEAPSAQTSQQAPQSAFLSSPSIQTPGIPSTPGSAHASHSQRDFEVIGMRIVENGVTVRSGYALFPALGRELDKKESQRTKPTRTLPRPEGAPSTQNSPSHPAQSFAEAPSAQTSQQAPQLSFLSSSSIQTPGTSSAPDSTQTSQSQRNFKIIRMRIVENAVTVHSGYALLRV